MKILLQIVHKVRLLYWWLVRPVTHGSRAIIVNKEGQIILVKHRYQEGWILPGGKIHRNETSEEGLRRELKEELGITDISDINKLGEYQNSFEYKKDTIVVFVVGSYNHKPKKHFEIESWEFFNPRALPQKVSPGTKRRIKEFLKESSVSDRW